MMSVRRAIPLIWAVAFALAMAGCSRPVAETKIEEPVVESVAPTPTPAPKVEPVAVAPPTPPPVAEPELAPPGIFYLLVATRVETADGIVGLKPGTGLKWVRPSPSTGSGSPMGIYLCSEGEVTLAENQVTNDLGVARKAAGMDAAQQARLSAQTQALRAKQAARDKVPLATPSTSEAPARSIGSGSLSAGGLQPSGGIGQKKK